MICAFVLFVCRSALRTAYSKELIQLTQMSDKLTNLQRGLPMFGVISDEEEEVRENLMKGSTDLLAKMLEAMSQHPEATCESQYVSCSCLAMLHIRLH